MQSSLVKIQHISKPSLTLNLRNLELFQDEEQGNEKNKIHIDNNTDSKERFGFTIRRPCIKVGTPQLIKEGRLRQVDKKKNELMKQLMGEEITTAMTKKIMQTEPSIENELLKQLEEISTPQHFSRKFFHCRSSSRPRDYIKIEQFIGDKQVLKSDSQRASSSSQQQQRFRSPEKSRNTLLKALTEDKAVSLNTNNLNNNTNSLSTKISSKPKESIYYYNHYEGNNDRSSKIFGQLLLSPLKKEQKQEQIYSFQLEQFKMLSPIKPRRPSLISNHKHSFKQYTHDIAPKSQSSSSFLIKAIKTVQELSPVSSKINTFTEITDEKETAIFKISNQIIDEQDDYGIDSYVEENRHKM